MYFLFQSWSLRQCLSDNIHSMRHTLRTPLLSPNFLSKLAGILAGVQGTPVIDSDLTESRGEPHATLFGIDRSSSSVRLLFSRVIADRLRGCGVKRDAISEQSGFFFFLFLLALTDKRDRPRAR